MNTLSRTILCSIPENNIRPFSFMDGVCRTYSSYCIYILPLLVLLANPLIVKLHNRNNKIKGYYHNSPHETRTSNVVRNIESDNKLDFCTNDGYLFVFPHHVVCMC